jgi:hypothetical protein
MSVPEVSVEVFVTLLSWKYTPSPAMLALPTVVLITLEHISVAGHFDIIEHGKADQGKWINR